MPMTKDQRAGTLTLVTSLVTLCIEKGLFTLEEWEKQNKIAEADVKEVIEKEG